MSDNQIRIAPNGPILCSGPVTVTDPAGNEHQIPEGVSIALCRCGLSTEKPFCTGNHRGNFSSEHAITRTFG